MKKLLFLLLTLIFLSCEDLYLPIYIQPSEPHLTGREWIFTDYQIAVVSSISDVVILESDTICINAFGEQKIVTGGVLMKQNYPQTMDDRKFIRRVTTWEFDDNSFTLYINRNINKRYPVYYPGYMKYERTQIRIENPDYGAVTNFTFITDAAGTNYPTKLTLTSPEIVSDLLLSNGMRDKAVTVKVILIFTR